MGTTSRSVLHLIERKQATIDPIGRRWLCRICSDPGMASSSCL